MSDLTQISEVLLPYCGKPLFVGFSGGADSTALLVLLLRWGWSPELLTAVHFEHGLRGEASRRDAEWCENFARARGVPFVRVDLVLPVEGGNVEARAREARYAWFRKNASSAPVVLAHHADDADETMLLKLARGGNAGAVAGLRAMRKVWNLTLLRPLLAIRKAELEDFLRHEGITDWRVDATNQDAHYFRNYLRNRCLPELFAAFPAARKGLAQARKVLADDADFLDAVAEAELAKLGTPAPVETPLDFWQKLHPAICGRVLPRYLDCENVEHEKLERFGEFLESAERIFVWDAALRFVKRKGCLRLERLTGDAPPPPIVWNWRETPEICWGKWQITASLTNHAVKGESGYRFDANLLPETLVVRGRQGGETFRAWGESRPRSLKHLLTSVQPLEPPVILSDETGEIYAVFGVRRSALAPVTENTLAMVTIAIALME